MIITELIDKEAVYQIVRDALKEIQDEIAKNNAVNIQSAYENIAQKIKSSPPAANITPHGTTIKIYVPGKHLPKRISVIELGSSNGTLYYPD